MCRRKGQCQPIMSNHQRPSIVAAHCLHPMPFRHQGIIRWHQMIECEQPNAGFCRDEPDIFRKRVAGNQMLLQPRAIAHTRNQPIHAWFINRFMHQNIGPARECREWREKNGVG